MISIEKAHVGSKADRLDSFSVSSKKPKDY